MQKNMHLQQEKRQNVDLKNQAETLCYEAEKELNTLKDNIPEEKQTSVQELIETIRKDLQTENFESVQSNLENLKMAMKDMIELGNQTDANPMSDLNDL